MKDAKLFLVSAPSGAGKSSLIDAVLARANKSDLPLELSVSYTTRLPRKGESNANEYFFVSEEDFLDKKNSNFFWSLPKFMEIYMAPQLILLNQNCLWG